MLIITFVGLQMIMLLLGLENKGIEEINISNAIVWHRTIYSFIGWDYMFFYKKKSIKMKI